MKSVQRPEEGTNLEVVALIRAVTCGIDMAELPIAWAEAYARP